MCFLVVVHSGIHNWQSGKSSKGGTRYITAYKRHLSVIASMIIVKTKYGLFHFTQTIESFTCCKLKKIRHQQVDSMNLTTKTRKNRKENLKQNKNLENIKPP